MDWVILRPGIVSPTEVALLLRDTSCSAHGCACLHRVHASRDTGNFLSLSRSFPLVIASPLFLVSFFQPFVCRLFELRLIEKYTRFLFDRGIFYTTNIYETMKKKMLQYLYLIQLLKSIDSNDSKTIKNLILNSLYNIVK